MKLTTLNVVSPVASISLLIGSDVHHFVFTVHIYIYMYIYIYVCEKKKNLNRTLAIDSPFQTLAVGLLVESID